MMSEPRDDGAWYAETRRVLEEAYLQATDPRGQSGFRGDETRWERARRPIVGAIHRSGTFLDVGCANGLLMESMVAWPGNDSNGVVFVRVAWVEAGGA